MGDEQAPESHKSTENLEQAQNGEKLKVDSEPGKENLVRQPSTTNMASDKEKEKKKPAKPDQEPFEAWEREEMEKLLGELRGHLGKILYFQVPCIFADAPNQSYTQHDSWKERTSRTISSSTRTGLCRSKFTTDFFFSFTHYYPSMRSQSAISSRMHSDTLPLHHLHLVNFILKRSLGVH